MVQCPKCQAPIEKKDLFCASCGFAVDYDSLVEQNKVVYIDTGSGHNVASFGAPTSRYPKVPAPLFERFIAFSCDMAISVFLAPFFGLGLVYFLLKDSLNEGRSIGKGAMGLRVIRYDTRRPANCSDSFGRNCGLVCAPSLFFQDEHRHLSDLTAGTIVIKDS